MSKGRLEAFSDGVLAIVITIMVLELHVPSGASQFADLAPVAPVFLSYVLSFLYIAIYWNNHHHLMQSASGVSGGVLWANMHLLFWLSLIPFTTRWMGETHFATAPTFLYGAVLLLASVAYLILQNCIIAIHGNDSVLARAIGQNAKGRMSVAAYVVAMPLTFAAPWISGVLYALVALAWLVPDRRIERALAEPGGD